MSQTSKNANTVGYDTFKISKYKKKHEKNVNLEEPITNIVTKENVLKISKEIAENTKDIDFNKCLIKKKKRKINESADTQQQSENLNDNLELLTPKKKKKKHENYVNLKESITKIGTKENVLEISKETVQNTNDYDSFNKCLSKKKKHKIMKYVNLSQNNEHLSDNFKLLTPKKKKKKHQKYINSEEPITNTGTKENVLEISNESVQNTNDYDSLKKCLRKKEKHKIMKPAGISLDSEHLSDNFDLLTPKKKKKKHQKYINSEEAITKISTKENVHEISNENVQNINDYDRFNKYLRKKKKHKIMKSASMLVDNEQLSDNFELLAPIKKKKKQKKIVNLEEPITKIGTKENVLEISNGSVQNTNDYDHFNKCLRKKKKHKIMKSASMSLDNEHLSENFELLTSKIKQEINVNSEVKLYEESKIFEINNDYNNFNECLIEKSNYDNSKVNGKVLQNEKTTTVINEHGTSLDLLELTTNNNKNKKTKNTIISDCTSSDSNNSMIPNKIQNKKMDELYMISNDVSNIVGNIKSLLQNFNDDETCIDSTNYLNLTFNKNNFHKNNEIRSNIFAEICASESWLDLDSYNLEESDNLSATEIKTELKDLKLFYNLIDSFSFVDTDINRTVIEKDFILTIKKTINLDCKTLTQSDIALLKYIGEKILNKIINKYKNLKVLEDLHIELPDDSKKNKLHFVETQLSKQPSKNKMHEFKQLNPSLKSGVFTEEEDNLILQYWHKFQQEYNISDSQAFISNGWKKKKQKFTFFRYIAAGLPNRLLISVFNRFNVLFGNFLDKSSFTEQEDRIITKVDSCEAIKNKFSVLNLILKRSRLQLYRRLDKLKMKPFPTKHTVWDLSKRQELFTYILSETKTKDWKDLQNKTINKNTWINVSKRFSESINYEQVKYQWKVLSTMLFCKTRINILKFKLIILEYLIKLNPKYWADINWIHITNKFYPGANNKVIVTMFHWWVCKNVPLEIRKCVRDTLKHLSDKPMNNVLYKIANKEQKYFPALEVENNILKEID